MMDDPELAEIRAQRLAELQARQTAARSGQKYEGDNAKRYNKSVRMAHRAIRAE
jgi:DNA-binding TFAR19-related protein (PDSD5 family)